MRSFILILFLFFALYSCLAKRIDHTLEWNLIKLPPLHENWKLISKDQNKITFECVHCKGEVKPGIYMEYVKVPDNQSLTIDELLKKTLKTYEAIYDNVKVEPMQVNGILGYKIYHSIIEDNRKLQTILIPKGLDYATISFFSPMNNYEKIKIDFESFINKLQW